MDQTTRQFGWLVLFCLAVSPGCQKPTEQSSTEDQKAVRDTFVAFQVALKARDADKLWSLLDSDSQADADRAAKAIRDAYAKVSAEKKADQEKAFGLPGAELSELTGKGFLKTRRFHGKYHEVPDATIDNVTVDGNKAVVDYTEADGDNEKLRLVRQEGKWKLSLKDMPKATQS
jgi:hypothetical protein